MTLMVTGSWALAEPPTRRVLFKSMSLVTLVYDDDVVFELMETATGMSTTLFQLTDLPRFSHKLLTSDEMLLKVYVLYEEL